MSPREIAIRTFKDTFNTAPTHVFQAPGRVNLIGEHTDYNDGFVLPCAINFQTSVAARPRQDDQVHMVAADYESEEDTFTLHHPIAHHQTKLWANYIRGVFQGFQERNLKLSGLDLAVSGNIPQGAGLSSSAALEVAIGWALNTLSNLNLSPTDIALIGEKAENDFVGTKCGIMDQLISANGKEGHALLIDCRSLETKQISIPGEMALVVIDSNVKRGLVESLYNDRRKECETAATLLNVKALRDIDEETFKTKEDELPPLIAKRARHVISENARTLEAAAALKDANLKALGHLMAASHLSMRNDFEITVPPIDALVGIAQNAIGSNGGARMTGGGFGGCVIALAPRSEVAAIKEAVLHNYEAQTGLQATVHVCTAAGGARQLAFPSPS
jgi:galactokinase